MDGMSVGTNILVPKTGSITDQEFIEEGWYDRNKNPNEVNERQENNQ